MDKDEVICISSDDDDAEQNKTKNKQSVIAKQLEDNHVSCIKPEVSSIDYKRRRTYVQKRKACEISNEIGDNFDCESSSKVLVCETNDDVTCNVEEEEKKEEVANKTLIKPHLVVKEKRTISPVVQDVFPMFISLCLQRDHSKEMKVIVNKLKRRYEQLDPMYANCEAFIDFLNEKRNDILYSKSRLYIHIAEVMNEMKRSCKGKSTLLSNGKSFTSSPKKLNIDKESDESNTLYSNMLHTCNSTHNDEEYQQGQYSTQKKINLLLKTMERCERYIKQLEEAEVNFETENNSNYIKLEKYKCRMVKLYEKYCQYTEESADAGRQYLRPKHFSTTGIVAVDHAITSFINSKISKRNSLKKIGAFTNALIFPDYNDILKCVTKCNELHNLGLDNKKQQQIAKKAFIELGEYLQRCRRNDYWDTFSLFLENEEEDPALKDPTLAEKLLHNKEVGEKKLSNIFEEFVNKQGELKDQATDSKTSSENEGDEEDALENEDEDEDDNEDDGMAESDASVDIEKDRTSTDEDEESTDRDEIFMNKRNTSIKTSIEMNRTGTDLDLIETEKTQKGEITVRLKDDEVNNLKEREFESNFNEMSINRNGGILSPDVTEDVNSSPTVIQTREEESKPNGMNADQMNDKPLEEKEEGEKEEKPLLRVRSFAKPPTTWKDVYEKVNEHNIHENISKKLTDKDVIDLTKDSQKEKSTVYQCAAFQIGSKVLPVEVVKGKYKTFVLPAGKSVIKVKNITNNYVKLSAKNMDLTKVTKVRSDPIISSQQTGRTKRSTTIHLSSKLSINQQAEANNQAQHLQGKQKSTTVQTSQPDSVIVLSKKKG